MTVEIAVRVTAVEGRKVFFEVSAKDELETISSGTHGRFVVDIGKTVERLKAKAARSEWSDGRPVADFFMVAARA
jgi:predicted thioesterase